MYSNYGFTHIIRREREREREREGERGEEERETERVPPCVSLVAI